jgi:hypothetical protein
MKVHVVKIDETGGRLVRTERSPYLFWVSPFELKRR